VNGKHAINVIIYCVHFVLINVHFVINNINASYKKYNKHKIWSPENYQYIEDERKQQIYVFLLVHNHVSMKNINIKIPKFVLFEILKFL
jgi:hypothetical protein